MVSIENVTVVVLKQYGEPSEVTWTSARREKNWNLPPPEQNYGTEAMTVQQGVRCKKIKTFGCGFDSRWCHWNFSLT
jgi:hypothetical protein